MRRVIAPWIVASTVQQLYAFLCGEQTFLLFYFRAMYADFSFCVGHKVLITDPLDSPEEQIYAGRRLGVVQSVSISLERPSDPLEFIIGISGPGSSTTKLRLFP